MTEWSKSPGMEYERQRLMELFGRFLDQYLKPPPEPMPVPVLHDHEETPIEITRPYPHTTLVRWTPQQEQAEIAAQHEFNRAKAQGRTITSKGKPMPQFDPLAGEMFIIGQPLKNELRIHDETGGTQLIEYTPQESQFARHKFNQLLREGYHAFGSEQAGGSKWRITEFDPTIREISMHKTIEATTVPGYEAKWNPSPETLTPEELKARMRKGP